MEKIPYGLNNSRKASASSRHTVNCWRSVPWKQGAGQGWATPWAGIDCLFGLRGRCDLGGRGSPGPIGCSVCGWPRVQVSLAGYWLGRVSLGGTLYKVGCSLFKTATSHHGRQLLPPLVLLLPTPPGGVQPRWPACCSSALQAHACLQVFDLPVPLPGISSLLCTLSVTVSSQLDRYHPVPTYSLSHCCSLPGASLCA